MDILSLSDLDLRKALWSAKGYSVKSVPRYGDGNYFSLVRNGTKIGILSNTEDLAWEQSPPLTLAHTFPLVNELYDLGWDTAILCSEEDGKKYLDVICKDRAQQHEDIEATSDSSTDPSDAIAKAYLLVRREMNL